MDVGIVATHVPPAKGYGGVSVTCGVLTQAWAERGHRMALVASDESISGRLHAEDVQLGDTVDVRLYRCYGWRRWGFGLGAIPAIWRLCRQAPRLYIHGIATWPSTLAAWFCLLLRRPFIVAVHGGLMPEHVALIKRRKPHKWLFYRWLTFPTLRRAVAVHCTSDTEAEGVRTALAGGGRILLVPNGIDSRAFRVADYPAQAGLQLCFLGHVQQEKGINGFIRAWLQTRRSGDRLVVAGRSVDGAYFDEFLQLVAEADGAIEYRGYLAADEVKQLLAQSHFLVLPSGLEQAGGMRENFGNVVAEALACGRPALVAKGLAWDHLSQIGAGWVFERDHAAVCQVLRAAQAIDAEGWRQMSQSARRHAEQALDAVSLGDRVWQALTEPAEFGPVASLAEQRT
ncbi:glycosyltransferase family 4 protein [Methylomonas sp. DH-1]|uniref:glycosyltransferase family 4 protein n=1 Tax=Methylomonas sp. (strain DH-1) TaxID=1727196 RepID=UPI0007C8E3D3|nr:glycosyltransferase family 4 protein [Methylomonas sp. DH-1]ANE54741.1 glycosyl transferase family 1 [Methylomonas sp. DH-1]